MGFWVQNKHKYIHESQTKPISKDLVWLGFLFQIWSVQFLSHIKLTISIQFIIYLKTNPINLIYTPTSKISKNG